MQFLHAITVATYCLAGPIVILGLALAWWQQRT